MTLKLGIKISKETENVNTCTDDKLILSSDFDTLKIKTSDIATITNGNSQIVIPHNMNDIPCAFVIRKLDTNKYGIIGQTPYQVSLNNLTIFNTDFGLAQQYFRYYIFYEKLIT